MKRLLLISVFVLASLSAGAQKFSIQTNLLDWAALGTANIETGFAVARHFTIFAGGRYNPWSFESESPKLQVLNQQQTAYLGVRYWTWYVNTGLWFAAKAQYQNYTNTGIWRSAVKEGRNGWGGGLSVGYTYLLTQHLNLEFGVGGWVVHYDEYNFYESQRKLSARHEGPATLIYPDFVSLSLVLVF